MVWIMINAKRMLKEGNHEDDDFEIAINDVLAGNTIYAVGTFVGDNSLENGEYLRQR